MKDRCNDGRPVVRVEFAMKVYSTDHGGPYYALYAYHWHDDAGRAFLDHYTMLTQPELDDVVEAVLATLKPGMEHAHQGVLW